MRGDVREILELAIALLQLDRERAQLLLGALALADVARDDDRAAFHIALVQRRDGDADVDPRAVFVAEDALLDRGSVRGASMSRNVREMLVVEIVRFERVDRSCRGSRGRCSRRACVRRR